jgi:hypothetical protein
MTSSPTVCNAVEAADVDAPQEMRTVAQLRPSSSTTREAK